MKKDLPIVIFIAASFIVLPAISLPVLTHIGQAGRFSFMLGGYWGFATQILALRFRAARIWRIQLWDDGESKRGKWITAVFMIVSIAVFIFGVYYALWGWTPSEAR